MLSWLTCGSVGPFTNFGYHDFFGSGFVYVFSGAMALVLLRRLGPRPGMFTRTSRFPVPLVQPRDHDDGVVLVFAGLPMVILSCGFFEPEALFVSVTMAESGLGAALDNLGLAWVGGALIANRTKKDIYTLLGPFAGYVSGAPAFDVHRPWAMFLVALGAPRTG